VGKIMKMVIFDNGKYGVRKFWFFGWHFVDLFNNKYSWHSKDLLFRRCMGTKEQCDSFIKGPAHISYRVLK
jgi:hypothetical protein